MPSTDELMAAEGLVDLYTRAITDAATTATFAGLRFPIPVREMSEEEHEDFWRKRLLPQYAEAAAHSSQAPATDTDAAHATPALAEDILMTGTTSEAFAIQEEPSTEAPLSLTPALAELTGWDMLQLNTAPVSVEWDASFWEGNAAGHLPGADPAEPSATSSSKMPS